MKTNITLFTGMLLLMANLSFSQAWDSLVFNYELEFLKVPKIFVSPDDQTIIAAYKNDSKGLYTSKDGGQTWTHSMPGKATISIEFGPDGTIYYISALKVPNVNSYKIDTLYTSTDGINWTNMGYKLMGGGSEYDLTVSGNNTLYFPNHFNKLSRSTDNGLTWTETAGNGSATACSFTGDTVLQGTDSPWPGGINYSHDGGVTFTKAGGINSEAIPLVLPNGDIYAATIGQIWKSTDGGINFTKLELGVPNIGQVQEFFYGANGKFYIRVTGGVKGIWVTNDFQTMGTITDNFSDPLADMDLSANYAYIATSDGKIYRRAIASATSVTHTTFAEDDIEIYPNPASNYIQLKSIHTSQTQAVQLLDLLGRTVLFNDNAEGIVDIREVPPGVYFLKVNTPTKEYVKRVIIQ